MSDPVFPKGMNIKRNPKAPDFVIGKIGIKVDEFIQFLQQKRNANGWVNIEVKKKKADGSPYLELDTWEPSNQQQPPQQQQQPAFNPDDDIAF